MKKNKELIKFENEFVRNIKVDIQKNFELVEEMYREAVFFDAIPPKDKLEGLEIDIKIAKVVNNVSKTSKKSS